MTNTPDNHSKRQAFFASLKDTYGESLELYRESVSEEDRSALRDQWEQDLHDRGLPTLELANLVALSTLLPYLEFANELSLEEFQQLLAGHFLTLMDDVINPNREV